MAAKSSVDGMGMVLRAGVQIRSAELAKACGRSDGIVPRGTEIPTSALGLCRNSEVLLSSGALKLVPPSAPRPVVQPAPPRDVPPVKSRDFIGELRAALKPHLDRGVPFDVCQDWIDPVLMTRALKQFSDTVGRSGAFGRSVHGFRQHVVAGV